MKYYIVKFACSPEDTPKNFFLDEEVFDRWVMAEPPEGYSLFNVIWSGEICMFITNETINVTI